MPGWTDAARSALLRNAVEHLAPAALARLLLGTLDPRAALQAFDRLCEEPSAEELAQFGAFLSRRARTPEGRWLGRWVQAHPDVALLVLRELRRRTDPPA